MAKQLKLKCVETYNSTWRFTRGKEYPLMGNLKEDPHVISDNGLHLYLMEYNDGYIGAGVPGHKFKMKNKKLGYLFSKNAWMVAVANDHYGGDGKRARRHSYFN